MSTESVFAPLAFPALPGQGTDERDSIRGHAAGYAAGRKQADLEAAALRQAVQAEAEQLAEQNRARVGAALEALARAADDYRSRQVPALQSVDASLSAAAIELAEAIVGHELADGSARAALDRATLEAVPQGSVVRLSPHDIAVISDAGSEHPGLELVSDFTLEPGDAVVELAHGTLDARVAGSLARAKAVLAEGRA